MAQSLVAEASWRAFAPLLVAAVILYSVYRCLLPRPLAGIPYSNVSAKRLMGDIPEFMGAIREGRSPRVYMGLLARRFQSPIYQVFMKPFGRPSLVVVDFRETLDILPRRTKEFHRGAKSTDPFGTIVPGHHISMQSSNPRFKVNKEIVKDLMTPAFLNSVSAQSIYNNAELLIEAWRLKERAAQGRPFDGKLDLHKTAFDILWDAAFGSGSTETKVLPRLVAWLNSNSIQVPKSADEPATFDSPDLPAGFQAIMEVSDAVGTAMMSPQANWHIWLLKRFTRLGSAIRLKDQIIHTEIENGIRRIKAGKVELTCAMDFMLDRERRAAEKKAYTPDYHTARIQDELFGYIVGGHDTTATTLMWLLKMLADVPSVQAVLRQHLRAIYTTAYAEGRAPAVQEIIRNSAPYLEAVIEEGLRLAQNVMPIPREATVDTTLLGHHVPKGTEILFYISGASIRDPPYPIEEDARSASSRAHRDQVGVWDEANIADFIPERWLRAKADNSPCPVSPSSSEERSNDKDPILTSDFTYTKYKFDPQAGPMLLFGAGPRMCFGRRLGYLQLRLVIVLAIWTFELLPVPDEINSSEPLAGLTSPPRDFYARLNLVK